MEQPHLNLQMKTLGRLPLLEVEGDLDLWTSQSFVEMVNRVIETDCDGIVLDLRKITSMDPGSLQHLLDACKALGPDRKLCAVTCGVSEQLIKMTRLDSVMQVCSELDAAAEYFDEEGQGD